MSAELAVGAVLEDVPCPRCRKKGVRVVVVGQESHRVRCLACALEFLWELRPS